MWLPPKTNKQNSWKVPTTRMPFSYNFIHEIDNLPKERRSWCFQLHVLAMLPGVTDLGV